MKTAIFLFSLLAASHVYGMGTGSLRARQRDRSLLSARRQLGDPEAERHWYDTILSMGGIVQAGRHGTKKDVAKAWKHAAGAGLTTVSDALTHITPSAAVVIKNIGTDSGKEGQMLYNMV